MGQFVAIRPEYQFDSVTKSVVRHEVFGRPISYDTYSYPVVRNAAAEIRKKLRQYYYEAPFAHEVRIELPNSRYLLHFEFVEPKVKAALFPMWPEPVVNSVGYYAGRDINTLYPFWRLTI